MSRHLIDDIAVGWDELGTDLLAGAPPALIAALTGGERWPSRTLDHLITPDGPTPTRMTVTPETVAGQDLRWGYVLHHDGIEVINLHHESIGAVVDWAMDPCTAFNDNPRAWSFRHVAQARGPVPTTTPRSAPSASPGKPVAQSPSARR